MTLRFYQCGARAVACAGECDLPDSRALAPNTSEGATEKHLPVVTRDGSTVTVRAGSVEHPSTQEHFIGLIALETDCGVTVREICPEQKPRACFALCEGEKPLAAYAFCNLHGLWKTEI